MKPVFATFECIAPDQSWTQKGTLSSKPRFPPFPPLNQVARSYFSSWWSGGAGGGGCRCDRPPPAEAHDAATETARLRVREAEIPTLEEQISGLKRRPGSPIQRAGAFFWEVEVSQPYRSPNPMELPHNATFSSL